MVTVINSPSPVEKTTTIERTTDSGAGWAVAVVILLVVIVAGAYLWVHYHRASAAAPSGGTNINVTLPNTPSTGATSNTAPTQ